MEKTKVFSIRVSESLDKKIQKILANHIWWKRNTAITHIIECVCDCADYDTINKILTYNRYKPAKFRIKLEWEEISTDSCSM